MNMDSNEMLKILKKYVKIIGVEENEQLIFKEVSTKKNKKDFEKIKEWLND